MKIIGITPQIDYESNRTYVGSTYLNALRRCGAVPLELPLEASGQELAEILSRLDGLLLTGGPDIDPQLFGEDTMECCGRIVPSRDSCELAAVGIALDMDMPIFGICRGIQVMAVALGGTLYQDVVVQNVSPEPHSVPPYDKTCHSVSIIPGTLLSDILSVTSLEVNSAHHQAVKCIPSSDLPEVPAVAVVNAITEYGLIEAISCPSKKFALGVQWHPECLPEDENMQKLFEAFVRMC